MRMERRAGRLRPGDIFNLLSLRRNSWPGRCFLQNAEQQNLCAGEGSGQAQGTHDGRHDSSCWENSDLPECCWTLCLILSSWIMSVLCIYIWTTLENLDYLVFWWHTNHITYTCCRIGHSTLTLMFLLMSEYPPLFPSCQGTCHIPIKICFSNNWIVWTL